MRRRLLGRAPPFEVPLDLTSLAAHTHDASRVLVTGTLGRGLSTSLTAFAAEYDLEKQRFLAGTVELGVGAASRIVPFGGGHFVLLPWSAAIVRVTRSPD